MIDDVIKEALANHVEAYLTVQSYHWNVEGVDFEQYHKLFGKIYADWYEQVDILGEYIRSISSAKTYVNASLDIVALNKTIDPVLIVGSKAKQMCSEIIELNSKLSQNITAILKEAQKQELEGLVNYCADRLDSHDKLNWVLQASVK